MRGEEVAGRRGGAEAESPSATPTPASSPSPSLSSSSSSSHSTACATTLAEAAVPASVRITGSTWVERSSLPPTARGGLTGARSSAEAAEVAAAAAAADEEEEAAAAAAAAAASPSPLLSALDALNSAVISVVSWRGRRRERKRGRACPEGRENEGEGRGEEGKIMTKATEFFSPLLLRRFLFPLSLFSFSSRWDFFPPKSRRPQREREEKKTKKRWRPDRPPPPRRQPRTPPMTLPSATRPRLPVSEDKERAGRRVGRERERKCASRRRH